MTDESRLDEQLLSQAMQMGLSSQLDDAEAIEVDVHTDLLKAAQGQADSVSVSGHGMVAQNVRVEDMALQVNHLDVNPLSLLFGKLKLNQPLDAAAKLTLTEADLNRAMNSDAIATRIPPLKLQVETETVIVELQRPIQLHIPEAGKIQFSASAHLHKLETTQQIRFALVASPRSSDRPLLIESFTLTSGQGISLEFILALIHQLKQWLDAPYLEVEGTAFRVNHINIQVGKITLETEAYVRQVPDLG